MLKATFQLSSQVILQATRLGADTHEAYRFSNKYPKTVLDPPLENSYRSKRFFRCSKLSTGLPGKYKEPIIADKAIQHQKIISAVCSNNHEASKNQTEE